MVKNIRLLLTICLLAIAGVIVLQFYWIKNYYRTSLFNFEREVNLVFEDAIREEFRVRCDTIEQLLTDQLMDTSAFTISSRSMPGIKYFVHHIYNAKDKKDHTSFSTASLPDSLMAADTGYKRKIAQQYAHNLRTEDLENHVVYFRTQSLGHFTQDKVKAYGFDTARLRPVLQQHLTQQHIDARFRFHIAETDSLSHYIQKPEGLFKKGMVITKALPTYKWWTPKEQYVRVIFDNPVGYVFTQMKWVLGGSLLLVVLVALSTWLLLKALFYEKRLAVIKNDFVNNITHELKTPVATIAAAIEALQDKDTSKAQQSRYLEHAENETKRLAGLIDHILHISVYDKTLSPQRDKVAVAETLQVIIERLQIASGKPINYQFNNNSDIAVVSADPELFNQALTNVLDNAVKYSGAEVNIHITCYTDDKYFYMHCNDTGEGIATDAIPYVFDKFYREPKPHHAVKGYGLGLNYVLQIMNAHQGAIDIKSKKGVGSTVTLSWPL
jgi:two-component system phosphate regulon sensor histidine kinase PhoR